MPNLPRVSIRSRMTARDTEEQHRAASPLELLFDLTFVVAIAQVATQLADSTAHGTLLSSGLLTFAMVFFAIWWAWINFTWFASAYDTDDVPYRLLTILQMGGVLVLAAGVPSAFQHGDFTVMTIGYVIMRIAMVAQWLRAGIEDPASRGIAFRYAWAITAVQVLWVARLLLPPQLGVVSFFLFGLFEVLVPVYAEHRKLSAWHPHHIAERYGLFTIILLGECVSATTVAVQGFVISGGVTFDLVLVAVAGLILLFSLWWLYFMVDPAEGLRSERSRSFLWGYGHYFLFASIAAISAGLEVVVEQPHDVAAVVVAYALAAPVALFFLSFLGVNAWLRLRTVVRPWAGITAAALVLLVPLAAPAIGVPFVAVLVALITAVLVAVSFARRPRTD
jgi:low temperature requirement protein LtrA